MADIPNPAVNLQNLEIFAPEHQDVYMILQASRERWLRASEWQILFNRRYLFLVVTGATIPIEEPGVYRIDNNFNQDWNDWETTFGQSYARSGNIEFNVRIARTVILYDQNGNFLYDQNWNLLVHPDDINCGWRFVRKTIRNQESARSLTCI